MQGGKFGLQNLAGEKTKGQVDGKLSPGSTGARCAPAFPAFWPRARLIRLRHLRKGHKRPGIAASVFEALCLLLAMTRAAGAAEIDQVKYAGGTAWALGEGAAGRLDASPQSSLIFESAGNRIAP